MSAENELKQKPVDVVAVAERARALTPKMAAAPRDRKDAVLRGMAARLKSRAEQIVSANTEDIADAQKSGVAENLLKRLRFDSAKLESRIRSLEKIAALPDPVGEVIRRDRLSNGLIAARVRVPLGVILMIYEARPHVSINAGAFCMKSGNACILRGGSEARRCNALIGRLWGDSLEEAGLPRDAIQTISGTHAEIRDLLQLDRYIDLVIPRGGKGLIEAVARESRIPVIKHYAGVCHVYVDDTADADMAVDIIVDSKCLMPSVCNALETVLVSRANREALVKVVAALQRRGVLVKGCESTRAACPGVEPAGREDWTTEYLDMIVAVRVVEDIEAAIEHINSYGSHHTDSIVTEDPLAAEAFQSRVDSAVVLANASTMFCDGESLGMGAEIGISTDKLHARGPMGLNELTGYKFVITGKGQVMGSPAGQIDS